MFYNSVQHNGVVLPESLHKIDGIYIHIYIYGMYIYIYIYTHTHTYIYVCVRERERESERERNKGFWWKYTDNRRSMQQLLR
jgi:hypothetical protein